MQQCELTQYWLSSYSFFLSRSLYQIYNRDNIIDCKCWSVVDEFYDNVLYFVLIERISDLILSYFQQRGSTFNSSYILILEYLFSLFWRQLDSVTHNFQQYLTLDIELSHLLVHW